jgi:hypothetical protein
VSQGDIDEIGFNIPDIELHATKNLKKDSWNTTDLLETANKVFRTGERTYCGKMNYFLEPVEKAD